MTTKLEDIIAPHYSDLSDQLKLAADFVLAHPFDIATQSMRSVAKASALAPATYTRLARAVELEDYEELKALCRQSVNKNVDFSFKERAARLQKQAEHSQSHFIFKQVHSSIHNAEELIQSISLEKLESIVAILENSDRVIVAGALASSGFAHYMAYIGGYCRSNWQVLGNEMMGAGFTVRDLGQNDTVFMITKFPNSTRAIHTVQFAKERSANVIVITDNHRCSALPLADHALILPTDSPQFFSSYVATTIIIETIVGMLVMRGGDEVRERISSVEENNRQIGEYWSDKNSLIKRETSI